ncbi:MAG: molybdopterin-dependent oxidoreductase [Deltaproteobacteria bacterium]|nr:molybdopterin-dependent oxidoreductase [Deltaproteobacteria bacterium]
MSKQTYVGKNIPKLDAREKATGQAIYAADLQLPGMLYGKIVRCWDHAHARVLKLDLAEAARVPGVIKVLGPQDVTRKTYNTGVLDLMVPGEIGQLLGDVEDQHIFTEHVRHQGDAICGIIAESEEIAELAAEKVKVLYEPLPVYLSAEESAKPDAFQFDERKPGNRAFQLPEAMFPDNSYGWGDVDVEMAKADLIVEETFYVPKVKQCQMEAHAYVAHYDQTGRLNCWTSTQMPKCVQPKLARLFELSISRVNLVSTTIGGGFGARLGMVFEPETCAMAMAVPGRPVKVQSSREEDWVASESRHPGKYKIKLGVKKDGTPVALDAHFTSNAGAYFTHASGTAFTTGSWLSGMYKIGALRYKGDTYYTNQAPSGAFRGYGNPQTNFALEQIVDQVCKKLKIDPVEWRKKWHKGEGDDGWCIGVPYSSCALDECLDRGAEAIGWKEKRAKYANQSGTKRRGIGVGVMNHTSGAMPMLLEHTTCTIKMNEDMSVVITLSCSDLGQGSHTVLKQIAADSLGISMDEIHILVNMDAAGFDIGSHASRTTYVGGGAVLKACEDVKRQLIERAAIRLEIPEGELKIKDQQVLSRKNPEKRLSVKEICHTGVYNFTDPQTGKTNGVPGQIQGYASHFPSHNSPPFGACFAEVEVDTETGEVQVLELVIAHDIGRAINPMAVEGQLEGGAHQALGMTLTEETCYDEAGLCRNNSFTDYKLFGPVDMPKITCILVEQPDPIAPLGMKSVGEAGPVNPVGATANAISHALGIMFTAAPITPEKILRAING